MKFADLLSDIERTYGEKKAIAKRIRLLEESDEDELTPSATEGETATDSSAVETETETEDARPSTPTAAPKKVKRTRKAGLTQHDLTTKYFRSDTLVFKNLDIFRYMVSLFASVLGLTHDF